MPLHCPVPKLTTHHIHWVVFGINTFILLCDIKALQLLNMQASKKPCAYWSVEETLLMLDLLTAQSSRIGQSASFPQSVYTKVAKSLNTRKIGLMVSSKFQAVRYFLTLILH